MKRENFLTPKPALEAGMRDAMIIVSLPESPALSAYAAFPWSASTGRCGQDNIFSGTGCQRFRSFKVDFSCTFLYIYCESFELLLKFGKSSFLRKQESSPFKA
ncbi:MAG: hypothetical protein KJ814_10965, partial [Proteobacteria bacterium]|nr:hypothetical protein [Pseudomonadota bacterium]